MNHCPRLAEIEVYRIQNWTVDQKANLDHHLASCDECRSVLQTNDELDFLLRAANQSIRPNDEFFATMTTTVRSEPKAFLNTNSMFLQPDIGKWLAMAASVLVVWLWISMPRQIDPSAIHSVRPSESASDDQPPNSKFLATSVAPRPHDGFLAVRDDSSSDDIEIVWVLPVLNSILDTDSNSSWKGPIQ